MSSGCRATTMYVARASIGTPSNGGVRLDEPAVLLALQVGDDVRHRLDAVVHPG